MGRYSTNEQQKKMHLKQSTRRNLAVTMEAKWEWGLDTNSTEVFLGIVVIEPNIKGRERIF